MSKAYEYRHVVGFAETNVIGNVYFTSHFGWQGRCREMFLRDHAPTILTELRRGLRLVTVRCTCDYLSELTALDEVVVRMRLGSIEQNRVTMLFEYWRVTEDGEELVARGDQQIACMREENGKSVPIPVPEAFREALRPYSAL